MTFKAKILLMTALATITVMAASIYFGSSHVHEEAEYGILHKSTSILSRLEAAQEFVSDQGLLDETIARAKEAYPDGDLPKDVKEKILKVVPVYAALLIGAKEAAKEEYKFRVATRHPRNPSNMATPLETGFLEQFEADPELKQLVHQNKETNEMWVMRPVHLSEKQGCMTCHGSPAESPFGNGKDILGYEMEDWSDGKLHGMFVVKSSLDHMDKSIAATVKDLVIWGLGITVLVLLLAAWYVNKPLNTLGAIAAKLRASASQGLEASDDLNSASQSVSEATTEQGAAIQETMASTSEMNSMVKKTLDLAQQTQEVSEELGERSKEGSQVMKKMVSSMNSIKEANERLNNMIEIINDISAKTNVINDIVFKTQLLSVNASIEAARAGQHGKGFAVVAEEVGNLAQISGKAAEEIREMLTNSQKQVKEIVEDTGTRVSEGERISEEAQKDFSNVAEGIEKIQGYSQSVNEATSQQQEGISQISAAMSQMDTASRQNETMSRSVAGLSGRIFDQSSELEQISRDAHGVVFGRDAKVETTEEKSKGSPKVVNIDSAKKDSKKTAEAKPTKVASNGSSNLRDKMLTDDTLQAISGADVLSDSLDADSDSFKKSA